MISDKTKTTTRIVFVIIAVILVLASLFACVIYSYLSAAKARELERINSLAYPYEEERRQVLRDLENFERLLTAPIPGGATMTILSINLDEEVYTNLWPIFLDAEMGDSVGSVTMSVKGALCVSESELPGMKDNITKEQFDEIIASGWSLVLGVSRENADRLDEYISEMQALLASRGIAFPETFCFESGVYKEDYDEVLLRCGIKNVIFEDSDDYQLVGSDTESGVWRVGLQGWSGVNNESTNAFNSLLTGKGGLVFGVEIWHSAKRLKATHFIPGDSEDSFIAMLGVFGSHVESGELYIDSVPSGRVNYVNFTEQYRLNTEVYQPAKDALVMRLGELEEELRRIYGGEIG